MRVLDLQTGPMMLRIPVNGQDGQKKIGEDKVVHDDQQS